MTDILLVGPGAREHALAWKLSQSSRVGDIFIAQGAGALEVATNVNISPMNIPKLVSVAHEYSDMLTIVGSEGPLEAGIVNEFGRHGMRIFGPTRAAAKLEWSKKFALQIMQRTGVPHPRWQAFNNATAVVTSAKTQEMPLVLKADGLASGKGVWICHTIEEVERAALECSTKYPGEIIVQQFLRGREVSVFAFTDGVTISPLMAACDYKARYEGNKGPNTGGMGSCAWPDFWSEKLTGYVMDWIMRPVIRHMAQLGTPFCGVLYAGLMITEEGEPQVLEFNCRLGDPETQVILPLLESDLLEVMLACAEGRLDQVPVVWNREKHSVGVVLVSDGYPGESVSDPHIDGLSNLDPGILVFEGGSSGRMMTLVATGPTVQDAREHLYENLARLELYRVFFRHDIGEVS